MEWIPLAVLAVGFAVAVIVRHGTPGRRRAEAHAFARKVDLLLEPASTDAVAGRLARRRCVGAVAGGAFGVATAVLARQEGTYWGSGTWLVLLAYFLGTAVGSAAVAWYESSRPLAPGRRVARATAPGHADYVPRIERWGAWGMAAVSALVAAGLAVLDGTGLVELGDLPGGLVVAAVVAPATVVVADELAARWLLDRRQVAATTLELAWDDALRAQTLRDTVTVALVTGAYLPFALLGVVGEGLEGGWPANLGIGVVDGVVLVLLVALIAGGVASIALRPERHFRRRLWSTDDVAPAPAPLAPGGAR